MKSTLAQGTILQGRYKVINKITTAGQSNIYKVIDVRGAGEELALKEMLDTFTTPQERAQARKQFYQQARILSSLSHPNLLKVITSFSEQDKDYLVMGFIHGATLEEILYTTPGFLEEHRVIAWAVQLCDALDYLHSQKPYPIIFRDIKPANIMLDEKGVIKLVDFGIARIFNPLKQTDTLKMGSLGYAPPEQYKGRGQTDERSDIYALGATMHHLLTKRDPQDEPPFSFPQVKPRDIRPDLSLDIEKVVMKAVEYDKNNRQSSIKELKAELLNCSSIVFCSTCASINARGTQTCVKDGTLLAPLTSKPKQYEIPRAVTSYSFPSQNMSLGLESSLSGTVLPTPPRCKVSPIHLDLGKLKKGTKGRASFQISNTGRGDLSGEINCLDQWVKVDKTHFNGDQTTINVEIDTNRKAKPSVVSRSPERSEGEANHKPKVPILGIPRSLSRLRGGTLVTEGNTLRKKQTHNTTITISSNGGTVEVPVTVQIISGLRNCVVHSLLWMYSIIAGIILGVISCPLIIVFGLIEYNYNSI